MPGHELRKVRLETSLVEAEISSRIQNDREMAAVNLRRQLVAQSLWNSESDGALLDAYAAGALDIERLREHYRNRLEKEHDDDSDV